MYNTEKYLKLLNSNALTAEEFHVAYGIFQSKTSNEIYQQFLEYWMVNREMIISLNILRNLENDGWIINNNLSDENIKLNRISATEKFEKLIIVDSDRAYEQAINSYPTYLIINNQKRIAKSGDHERLKKYYYQNVISGGDLALHQRFIYLTSLYHKKKNAERNWENWITNYKYIADEIERDIQNNKYDDIINDL